MRLNISQFPKLFLVSVFTLCSPYLFAEAKRSPQLVEPGLNDKWFAQGLRSEDFIDGTYRITKPGYYFLEEDIVFNPTHGRPDEPAIQWFAAISIEADDVILDLNTKSIEASENFIENNPLKSYCDISLNNAWLPPYMAPLSVVGYKGETTFKSAKNVIIRNGTLGRARAGNICGYENVNIRCYDLVCKDAEGMAIGIIGLLGGEFRNICISGTEHLNEFSAKCAAASWTLTLLNILQSNGVTVPSQYFDAMTDFLSNCGSSSSSEELRCTQGDGMQHALLLCPRDFSGADSTACAPVCEQQEKNSSHCICIEHVKICDICVDPIEIVAIDSTVPILGYSGPFANDTKYRVGPFILDWLDLGNYGPNTFIQAEVFAAQYWAITFPNDPISKPLPAQFITAILSSDLNALQATSKPAFGCGIRGFELNGLSGICYSGSCAIIKDNVICSLQNTGALGIIAQNIPSLGITPPAPKRYHGADTLGIWLDAAQGCELNHNYVSDLRSDNGSVFGHAITESDSTKVINSWSTNLRTEHDVNFSSSDESEEHSNFVTNPSEVYGFLSGDSDCILFFGNQAQMVQGPRRAAGFAAIEAEHTLFEDCKARNVSAFSDVDVSVESEGSEFDFVIYKLAAGFLSQESDCSVFRRCKAVDIRVDGECCEPVGVTQSNAFGFALLGTSEDLDNRPVVKESVACCIDGCAGISAGIGLLNTFCATILCNTVCSNHANGCGLAYGIIDAGDDEFSSPGVTNSIILRNLAYNNQTLNYLVNFGDAGTLPVATATNVNVKALQCANCWDNILIEVAPGVEQKEPECKTILSIFERCEC